ncbi:MAG TPA: TetR/AcrR family transcriptional regulator [Desulfomonilia bacterium]|nr:TetR/AcrR family transcriptional regulator [Desulfomonilia bacterium]
MKRPKGKHTGTESRRKAIIQAALACFSEIGFSETSMEDIRKRSKASTGSIYHHFKSKEQLAAEVYLEGIRDYQSDLISALEGQQVAKEGIRALIGHHLKWVEHNVEWSRYLFQKRHWVFMSTAEDAIAEMDRQLGRRAEKWFARCIRSGELRPLPEDIFVSLILGPCMEFTRQFLFGLSRTTIDDAVQALAEAAWRCLAGKQSGQAGGSGS